MSRTNAFKIMILTDSESSLNLLKDASNSFHNDTATNNNNDANCNHNTNSTHNTNYNADNSSSAYNPVSQHHAIPCAGPIDRGSNNQDSTS